MALSGEDQKEALLDVLDPSHVRYALAPLLANTPRHQPVALELIDTPGVQKVTMERGPNLKQTIDAMTAMVHDIGGIHAIVVVLKYAVTLTSAVLDALAPYLAPFSQHCKRIIVVHSYYFPAASVEAGRPCLDLSDRIAVTQFTNNGWHISVVAQNQDVPRIYQHFSVERGEMGELAAFLIEQLTLTRESAVALVVVMAGADVALQTSLEVRTALRQLGSVFAPQFKNDDGLVMITRLEEASKMQTVESHVSDYVGRPTRWVEMVV
ncbi:hypothetical protein GGF32_009380 [Allomyces javanicus]|nr:hypothetical protein GGF32_009380 [Allomyces javanicus]